MYTDGRVTGVPGEIKGYYEAWSRFGHLPWADLFQPTIQMCREGVVVGPSLAKSLASFSSKLNNTPSLK